jgi:CO dehydrogenase nickel-insertion accessory protein CooC1
MKGEQIQTLHPQAGKANKRISLEKYLVVKENILSILNKTEPTHTELMEAIYENLKDTFEGGIQWYGETVKLDLEARAIIERTGSKPEKYRLLQNNQE